MNICQICCKPIEAGRLHPFDPLRPDFYCSRCAEIWRGDARGAEPIDRAEVDAYYEGTLR